MARHKKGYEGPEGLIKKRGCSVWYIKVKNPNNGKIIQKSTGARDIETAIKILAKIKELIQKKKYINSKKIRSFPGDWRYKNGTVYFLQADDGPIKIGWTQKNIDKRIAILEWANPQQIILLGIMEGDQMLEQSIHEQFGKDKIKGEWFTPSPHLIAYIEANSKK